MNVEPVGGRSVVVMNRRRIGELGERIASGFLAVKGYEILQSNYRFARREIDIVARDGGSLVAVEVKLRRGRRFGTAAEAVDRKKIGRIRMALEGILNSSDTNLAPRIDVIAIDFKDDLSGMVLNHIEGVY